MPFYEYQPTSKKTCKECGSGFTRLQKMTDSPLTLCPECGAAVKRIISAPNVKAGDNHLLNTSNIEKAGFTQYRKAGKGKYEKTAGKGPDRISG